MPSDNRNPHLQQFCVLHINGNSTSKSHLISIIIKLLYPNKKNGLLFYKMDNMFSLNFVSYPRHCFPLSLK